jgi:two-component system, NarL family, sensor histidine kinase DesK
MIRMAQPGDHGTSAEIPFQRKLTGRDVARYMFTAIWFLYLIEPLSVLFSGRHHPALWVAGGIVIATTFCALFLLLVQFTATGRWQPLAPRSQAAYGVLFVLALVGCIIYGKDWVTLWVFVSSATGWVYPLRVPVMRALILVTGVYALTSWSSHAGLGMFVSDLLPVALVGMATAGFHYQVKLVHELSQARETVAKLAASEERLRLARDMHDLTGQSLSTITLKSDLVRKLLSRLPASKDRDQALGEAADIGRVSRQTLHDIREAVSGYRRPTLAVEIITARSALESAGVELDDDPAVTLRSGTFDGDAEAALAWCLREAVTNVIRHSGARHCRVRLLERAGELSLEIADDGRGVAGLAQPAGGESGWPPGGGEPAGRPGSTGLPGGGESAWPPGGTGLRGMSERLTAVGGRLSFGHTNAAGRAERGLRVVATVPAAAPPPSPSPDDGTGTASAGQRDALPAASPPRVPAGSE